MRVIVEEGASSPLEHLPLELVYHILRFASADSRRTALACACVSSEVRSATASELYHTVILRCPAQINGFVQLLLLGDKLGGSKAKASINPGAHVRNLVITHHIPSPSSTPSSSPPSSRPPSPSFPQALPTTDPLATIFELCVNVSRAVLQASFLHSSLVPCDPINRFRWLRGGELVIQGPVFPSDWEAHVDAILGEVGEAEGENLAEIQSTSVLSYTTHLTLLEPLSSPHISARLLAQLPRLTHIAVQMQSPHHPSTESNNPFTAILPLLASSSIIMVVVLLDTASSTYHRTSYTRRQMHLENEQNEREVRDQGAQERLDYLIDFARKIDERVYVVERVNRSSGGLAGGWGTEGLWH